MLAQVPISKFYIGLFTQSKWDTSCKEGFVGLDFKSHLDFGHAEDWQQVPLATQVENCTP